MTYGNPIDRSKYKKQHDETIAYVKKQTCVDLDKYRDGDGTNPSDTTYWDKGGVKVAYDAKRISKTDEAKLKQLVQTYGKNTIIIEQGGAWFNYIYLGKRSQLTKMQLTKSRAE